MMLGFLLTVITGLVWVMVGAIFSVAAKREIELASFMFLGAGLSTVFAWSVIPDYGTLIAGNQSRLLPLAFWMTGVAILAAIGFLALRKAMVPGKHGLAWTMGQAAMLIPFAAGTLIWQEEITSFCSAGMLFLAVSLPLCAVRRKSRSTGQAVEAPAGEARWSAWGLLAFALIGLSQVFSMVPSHWPDWTDSSKLRVPLVFLVSTLFWLTLMIRRKRKMEARKNLPLALGYAACVLAGQWLLYLALDRMAALGLSSMVYPLAIGTCIIGFYLYSRIALREKTNFAATLGVLSAAGGIILITLGSYW